MGIMLRMRTLPAPCLPTKTDKLPSGSQWLHEIKHDGFRIIARKTGTQVRLYSRPGNDLTRSFPLIVETLTRLRSRSCIIDGEAVACDDNGVASFDLIRHHRANERIFLYAFDLIELNGDDLRLMYLAHPSGKAVLDRYPTATIPVPQPIMGIPCIECTVPLSAAFSTDYMAQSLLEGIF
jgi:hypothetical protein